MSMLKASIPPFLTNRNNRQTKLLPSDSQRPRAWDVICDPGTFLPRLCLLTVEWIVVSSQLLPQFPDSKFHRRSTDFYPFSFSASSNTKYAKLVKYVSTTKNNRMIHSRGPRVSSTVAVASVQMINSHGLLRTVPMIRETKDMLRQVFTEGKISELLSNSPLKFLLQFPIYGTPSIFCNTLGV